MADTQHAPQPTASLKDRRMTAGFELSATAKQRLANDPVSVRGLMMRFALAGLVAVILLAVVTAFASVSVGTDLAITDARRSTWVTATGLVKPVMTDGVINRDRESLERLDQVVRDGVLRGALIRVKIWTEDGTIVYCDDSRLIGQRFDLDDHADMFTIPDDQAEAHAEVSDLSKPENQYETESKLLEVYLPMRTTEGTRVLYEAYFRYQAVTDVGQDLWRRFAPLAIGALLILELVQIPFAYRLARRLRAGQLQRELLLRHAIEASETERRRIAGDLHDGVVQELTGVSYSLAAAARSQGGDLDPRVGEASTAIRESVKSLRSLLVEIYPPNLMEEGLDSAVGDLLGRLTNRGVSTSLDVDPAVSNLEPPVIALIYRVTQEALRNVANHSGATKVDVRVAMLADAVELTVEDDGRGFDVDQLSARQHDGHVGLRALASLVQESGGQLTVRSAPSAGTNLQARLAVHRRKS